jgi:phage-related holin
MTTITAYLNIDNEMIGLFAVLVMIDLLLGVFGSIIYHTTNKVRFLSGFLSKIMLLMIPVIIGIMSRIVGTQLDWFISATISVLAIGEVVSILNKYLKLKGEKPLPDLQPVAIISNRLRIIAERLIIKGEVNE